MCSYRKYVLYNSTLEPGSPNLYGVVSPETLPPRAERLSAIPRPCKRIATYSRGSWVAYTCVYLETISVLDKTYGEIWTMPREYHATWFIFTITRLLRTIQRLFELFPSTHLLLTLEIWGRHWNIVPGCNCMPKRQYDGWSLVQCEHVYIYICLTSEAFFQPSTYKANPLLVGLPTYHSLLTIMP